MKKLKIYFTSDLHGYVYPTDYITKEKKNIGLLNIINMFKKDENTIIIDGGDTIQGSPFTNFISGDESLYTVFGEIMNFAKYDYVTLGNHDFNYGRKYLASYLNTLDAKCLCSNVIDKLNELPIFPYDIKVMNSGLKVGIIGITTDFINRWERAENIENFSVTDTYESIKKYSKDIKSQCDLIIGVYHGGIENDLESYKKLSSTTENIAYKICENLDLDILLTGHQHMSIRGQYIHNTYFAQTTNNGVEFLELHLSIDDDGKKDIYSKLNKVELNPNEEVYNKFLSVENKVQDWLDTPVGFLDTELHPTEHLKMALSGSKLANFINQIQLDESNSDIACTSFPNFVKGFDKEVTVRDIIGTYPFPNTLAVLEVDRNILKLALERSASYFEVNGDDILVSERFLKPKVEHYNYDYFSNLEYTFDLSKEVGERVISIKYKGLELDDNIKLKLVMNNYRASGAGGYEFYEDCNILKEIVCEMPEIIINYFKKNKNVIVDNNKYINIK